MNLAKVKTLILEDDVYKAIEVERALNYCGIYNIKQVSNQKAGFRYIYQCLEDNAPVQLIVTDMHYPLEAGSEADTEAGFKLLERLEKENLNIPVIICSSLNFREPKALGNVWYNKLRDIKMDFKEILETLE